MGVIAVTDSVVGIGRLNTICFPPLGKWERIDDQHARPSASRRRIAPQDYENRIDQFRQGKTVLLSGTGKLRLGCAMGLIDKAGTLYFGLFDKYHPSRPNCLTPPGGIFEGDCTPLEKAAMELSEEFVLRRQNDKSIGTWQVAGLPAYSDQAVEYANMTGTRFDPEFIVPVTLLNNLPDMTTVKIGDILYQCLVAFEPDSSSIELVFVAETCLPYGVEIVDGERFDNGTWRNMPVVTWPCDLPLNTKADVLIRTFGRS